MGHIFKIAKAFGEFQQQLTDLPGRLHETIPDFHNTPKRIEQLEKKVDKHNSVMERTYELEKKADVIDEKMKVIKPVSEQEIEQTNQQYREEVFRFLGANLQRYWD